MTESFLKMPAIPDSTITMSLCLFWTGVKARALLTLNIPHKIPKRHTHMNAPDLKPTCTQNQANTANSLLISEQTLYVRLKERPQRGQRFTHMRAINRKFIGNNYGNQLIVIFQVKIPNIPLFLLLKCDNLLFFFVLCDSKLVILAIGSQSNKSKLFKNINLGFRRL